MSDVTDQMYDERPPMLKRIRTEALRLVAMTRHGFARIRVQLNYLGDRLVRFLKQSRRLAGRAKQETVSFVSAFNHRLWRFRHQLISDTRNLLNTTGDVETLPPKIDESLKEDLADNVAFQSGWRPYSEMAAIRATRVPDNLCVYAIGDIHGQFDQLEALLQRIEEDQTQLSDPVDTQIVFLGDYIDRGLKSRQVIDLLLSARVQALNPIFLCGNHEEALLRFLKEPEFGPQWAHYGGTETLHSYGVEIPNERAQARRDSFAKEQAWMETSAHFRQNLPESHLAFYSALKPHCEIGDYVFVHAGLRPGVALKDQTTQDLYWIRGAFLNDTSVYEKRIVHGHTPTDEVHLDDRRLGLDTGAYMSGVLTAARLFGEEITLLSTAKDSL